MLAFSPTHLLQSYLARADFWAGAADYDFWYAMHSEDWYWLHVRRQQEAMLAVSIFFSIEGLIELDLYNLSQAGLNGLRATIVNTPLRTLQRFDPHLPRVALCLGDGWSHFFTLPQEPHALADQWLAEVLTQLHGSLLPRWHLGHHLLSEERATLLPHWPAWAGPPPPL